MLIGKKTRAAVVDAIGHWLEHYSLDIEEAYKRADGALGLTLTVSFSPPPKGAGVRAKVGIGFVGDRIKDQTVMDIDEQQGRIMDLLEETP